MTSTAGKQLQPSGPYEVARPRDTVPVGKVIDLSGFPSYEQVAVIVDGRTAELAERLSRCEAFTRSVRDVSEARHDRADERLKDVERRLAGVEGGEREEAKPADGSARTPAPVELRLWLSPYEVAKLDAICRRDDTHRAALVSVMISEGIEVRDG